MKPQKYQQNVMMLLAAAVVDSRFLDTSFLKSLTTDEWVRSYHYACQQGVLGLTFGALATLRNSLRPPCDIFFSWALHTKINAKNYEAYCRTAKRLSEAFERSGLPVVLLKGMALSTQLYPHPEWRKYSDIDIFCHNFEMSRKVVASWGIEADTAHPKHDHFYFENVMVENHKSLTDKQYVQGYSKEAMEQMAELSKVWHTFQLTDGTTLRTFPLAFYELFTPIHIYTHLLCNNITLRQICDWLLLVKKNGLHYRGSSPTPPFADALTNFCHDYLKLPYETPRQPKIEQLILHNILAPDNLTITRKPLHLHWIPIFLNTVKQHQKEHTLNPQCDTKLSAKLWKMLGAHFAKTGIAERG